jgi:cyclophilin family peptidyl-prolyl cis-trans isomerase
VVFGRVEKGYDICERIEKLRCNSEDKPNDRVAVADCGEVKPQPPKEEVKKEEVPKKQEQTTE